MHQFDWGDLLKFTVALLDLLRRCTPPTAFHHYRLSRRKDDHLILVDLQFVHQPIVYLYCLHLQLHFIACFGDGVGYLIWPAVG